MASTSADVSDTFADHIVRPRPRKPLHSQLSHISNVSDFNTNGNASASLELPENGEATGMTR
jgi:sterol O-acyltransferase